MTNIEISVSDKLIKIYMAGHSDYSEPGSDIVCSAISILEYIMYGYVESNPDQAFMKSYNTGAGYSYMQIIPKDSGVFEVVKSVITGFEALSKEYPENINLKKNLEKWEKLKNIFNTIRNE